MTLQQRGMEVSLVDARHAKNLAGCKSDIAWRHRAGLVAQASSSIQRIQKTLVEMNIQLRNVLSDLSGVSGMAILEAILAGERDAVKLAALANPQVKAIKAQ